ncbi:MBL fold metallo-hydrolase [Kitasatospora sp. NPDC050463]|uniref:MBL fold metallo-hydrolase n=1 Tax=Kitasatospora sp. NPDC050463 TaxID=3155786 RepID=UPI0033CE0C14
MGRHSINAYLLLGRRPVIVDAGIPGSGRRIHERITAHGVDPADVSLIVITHGHIDHFGSAAELHRLTGAPLAGHVADLGPYRSGRVREPYLPTGPMGRLIARNPNLHVRAEPFEPAVLVHGETSLEDFGLAARIMPTPGHTAGSISVLTDDGDLVAGDLIAGSFMASSPASPPTRPSTTIRGRTSPASARCSPSAPPPSTSATAARWTPAGYGGGTPRPAPALGLDDPAQPAHSGEPPTAAKLDNRPRQPRRHRRGGRMRER